MKYTLKLKGLPFEFNPKQIVYVENKYDAEVNDFIVRHHDRICNYFRLFGYEFCYLPLLSEKFDEDVCKYYEPQDGLVFLEEVSSLLLLDYMAHPQNRESITPSLIYYKEDIDDKSDDSLTVCGIAIGNIHTRDNSFSGLLHEILLDKSESIWVESRFRLIDGRCEMIDDSIPSESNQFICDSLDPIQYLEEQFDYETNRLRKEVEQKVRKLKQKGISLYALENILRAPVDLSRLVITSGHRIILPEYNDMEIEMTPLVKAVYFLFLRHPEGISFKHLSDYHDELLQIYTEIRGEELTDEMKKSVASVTSPLNNTISEKCARIREAFISKFDERLAEPYIVRGKCGEPKGISLSRNLVKWQ